MFHNQIIFVILAAGKEFLYMRVYTQAFNDMRAATDFINEKGITKDRVLSLFQSDEGLYLLVYYAE